jgi:hypothetical protein
MFLATLAHAQPLQVRFGLNYSSISGDDFQYRPGFYAGIQKNVQLSTTSDKVTFEPGIYYSLQATQTKSSRTTFHYLQVPMMFNFKLGEHVGLLIGPQPGMMFRATEKNLIGKATTDPVTPSFNSIALSIGGGPYVQINDQFRIEVRGMVDILGMGMVGSDNPMVLFQFGMVYTFTK